MNIINKIQKAISNKIQLRDTLNHLDDYGGVPLINGEGTLENLIEKFDKAYGFLKAGKADEDLSRYFPDILPVTRQQQIASEIPRKAYASVTYTDKKRFEFILNLTLNTYSNFSTMKICLPLRFTKKTNKNLQLDGQMMTVNNFFGHWFIDIDIRRYPDNLRVLPTNNSVDIYQYSNAQMKYLPEKSVKKLLKTMLYSNKPVYLAADTERRPQDDNDDDDRTNPNLTYRIKELKDYIFQKLFTEFLLV